jgi:hypothetical protein
MIQPGVYREQITITHIDLTIEGAGEGVYLLGSFVPALVQADGLYRAAWAWGASFAGTPFCSNLTNDVALSVESCNTRGFWQDGERLDQVFSKSAVVAGTF